MIRETLMCISRGGTLSEAAQEVGTSPDELRTLLGILEHMGYIETHGDGGCGGTGCVGCPVRCSPVRGEHPLIVAYSLTEKGRRLVMKAGWKKARGA